LYETFQLVSSWPTRHQLHKQIVFALAYDQQYFHLELHFVRIHVYVLSKMSCNNNATFKSSIPKISEKLHRFRQYCNSNVQLHVLLLHEFTNNIYLYEQIVSYHKSHEETERF